MLKTKMRRSYGHVSLSLVKDLPGELNNVFYNSHEQSSWGLDMKEKKDELLTHANARYLIATHVHIQVHVPQRGREKRMPS
jgi:hypothetical protein